MEYGRKPHRQDRPDERCRSKLWIQINDVFCVENYPLKYADLGVHRQLYVYMGQ